MAKDKKKQKWVLPRHKFIIKVARKIFLPYAKRKYNVKVEKFAEQGDRQYLVLINHQTAYDQFFVSAAFDGPVYYVATEDIFSMGVVSKLLRYAVAPIPIKKQVSDVGAVLTCKRVAREGGTIALMPEGNRTYSGETEYINPAISGLAKLLRLPIAIMRMEGGYGVQPRWSDVVRKGTEMRVYVSKVLEVEDYIKMDNDALYDLICKELYVDETKIDGEYHHKQLAQYVERALYVCPDCGLSELESKGDIIKCKKCGLKVKYLPNKTLKGIDKEIPFNFIKDWYLYQEDFINSLDINAFGDDVIMKDDNVGLYDVVLYKNKRIIDKKANVKAYKDRIEFEYKKGKVEILYSDASVVTVLGKNKLNVYSGDKVYQIKGNERFNALKYVNLYYRYKNLTEGDGNGRFLGL